MCTHTTSISQLYKDVAKKKLKAMREEISVSERQIEDLTNSIENLSTILECPWNHIKSEEALDVLIDKYSMYENVLAHM